MPSKKTNMPTLHDVARRAGVSIASVSRFINGFNTKEKTAESIRNAVFELNYQENLLARSLKNKRTMTIGALIYSFEDSFSNKIVMYAERIVIKHGYNLIVSSYESDDARLSNCLSFFRKGFVDGLIYFPLQTDERHCDIFVNAADKEIPVVTINQYTPNVKLDCIIVDNADAAFRGTEYLIHMGCRRIAAIIGLSEHKKAVDYTCSERLAGFMEAIKTYEMETFPEQITYGNYLVQGGHDCVVDLLNLPTPPDAIFVASVLMAQGAVLACKEKGVVIGRDIQILSFDYSDVLTLIHPSAPYIEQPLEMIGSAAAEMMLKRLSGDYSEYPKVVQLKTKLVTGKNTL